MGWLVPKFSDGGCVGMLVEVRFLSNCTPFLPDEADTPARKRKNRAGPPSGVDAAHHQER